MTETHDDEIRKQFRRQEMIRVCRPGKQTGIMDMVSPDDTTLAARYNRLERLRDPSHTRCLTIAELQMALKDAGLMFTQTWTTAVGVK